MSSWPLWSSPACGDGKVTRVSGLRCHLQRHGVVLVWLPVLLLFPLLNLSGDVLAAAGQVVLVLALAATAVALVVTRRVPVLLPVLVALIVLAALQGEGWQTVWGVLAIVSPAVLRGWRLLVAIVAATVGVAVSIAVIEGVGDAAGIRTSVTAAPAEVPDIAGQALAWVVREGATNVLRHSGAASCRFELTEDGGELRLAIVDDGVGGPGTGERSGGLEGLRQRLRAVDGRLDVSPGAEGFRLEARVSAS